MSVALTEAELRDFIAGPYRSVLRVVALVAGSRQVAEDAVHEAMARAWQRGGIDRLDRWVLTVALNLARSRWRKLRREVPLGRRAEQGAEISDDRIDLHDAVRALPRRQREVVVLHYTLDLSVAEIAELVGLSPGGVKNALFRARQSLAVALAITEEVRL